MSANHPQSWPQCVGMDGLKAKELVIKDFPGAEIHIVEEGSCVTEDERDDRVRIFVDENGKVNQAPYIG